MDFRAAFSNLTFDQIDFDVAEAEYGRVFCVGPDFPAQDGPDAGQQLADAKGLGQVIVGPGVQRLILSVSSTRAESTMTGVFDQVRKSRMKSTPSPSGSPR